MVKSIFNQSQIEFIKNNYTDTTYVEMSKLELFSGLDNKQIRNKARALGLSKTRNFDDSFFNNIDTANKAYWLGFIYADGYLSMNEKSRTYEFGIELHTDDRYILELLNKQLGDVHKISSRERNISFNGYDYISKCSRLRVYSKSICLGLISNGIDTEKTDSTLFPTIEDNELFMHFLRGFLDGDGCIYQTNGKLKSIHFTNSNVEFLEYIKTRLLDFNINSYIYKEKDKKYRLNISIPSGKEFLEIIYKNSNEESRLKRKFEIYKSL